MTKINKFMVVTIVLICCSSLLADCPFDHFLIGCNRDSVFGTEDDNKLFVDCTQKYRHSDPLNSGESTWLNWYYPLYYNSRYDRYQIGEPGFDVIGESDPNRQLVGTANVDYRIIIECVSITPGFAAKNTTLGITLDEANDWFNHSELSDSHIHLEYRAVSPDGATELQWITYRLSDAIEDSNQYLPSDEFTVVFVKSPAEGNLAVDENVDAFDLARFSECWLCEIDTGNPDAISLARSVDYFERADTNRDYKVDWVDFALLANNWLTNQGD